MTPETARLEGTPGRHQRLSTPLLLLMAVGCGVAVANLYYAQPLLQTIVTDFQTAPRRPDWWSRWRRSGTRPGWGCWSRSATS